MPASFNPFSRSAIEQSIPSRFEEQVRQFPQRLAVKAGSDAWTFAELNRWANCIARAVMTAPVTESQPVVLVLRQSALLIAAILGTLKAGRIYVPVDPGSPVSRITEILEDSGAGLVLADSRTGLSKSFSTNRDVSVLEIDGVSMDCDCDNPAIAIAPHSGAYIYYTSGSTGRPKGVLDTHRNVLHNIMRYTNSLKVAPDDRLTLLQGPAFSGAVSSMFAALLNGAACFPFDVPGGGIDRVAPWTRSERITIYHSVPALFRVVAGSGVDFPDLRVIRLEGDTASPRDVELFRSKFSKECVLVNGLGATECGLIRQYFVTHDDPVPDGLVPIGYAVEDMEVLLLDETGRKVPPGGTGEICVRSRYLSPGYWKQPELTASSFTVDPSDEGTRLYHTGDLGRFRADGCLEHLGRKDLQVKIRGNRVEIGEVEAALLRLKEVKDAAVVTVRDSVSDARLAAYIVPSDRKNFSVPALRRHLASQLPAFMVPSVFVVLASLPLTVNGKVDRRLLPAPVRSRPELDVPYAPPQTLLEDQLVRAWQNVLGVDPVGTKDEFVDLGGDSLLAVNMIAEVERLLQRAIPLSLMLAGPTIEHLAEAIQQEAADELHAKVIPVQTGKGDRPFFFLHGDYLSGGLYCRGLAGYMGTDQPLYALPPCGVNGGEAPRSYEAMAAEHVDALRSVQSHGPYRLGGLCNGGLVAYEMARFLEREGERVEFLALIGALPTNARLEWLLRLVRWMATSRNPDSEERLLGLVRLLRDRGMNLWSLPLGEGAAKVVKNVKRIFRESRELHTPGGPLKSTPAAPDSLWQLRRHYLAIDDGYTPGMYRGPVTLFWPSSDPVSPEEAGRRWHRVAPTTDVCVIPGSHFTCLTEHAHSAAEKLKRYLK